MKKIRYAIFLLAVGLFVFASPLHAQYQNLTKNDSVKAQERTGQVEKVTPVKKNRNRKGGNRLFFGGGIGGGYSTYSSYIQITPIIGYRLTSKFQIGSRLTYMHQWYKDYNNVKYNYDIYGGSLFLRYIFWKSLYAQTEYEILSVPDYYSADANANRAVHSLFAGMGFIQHMGGSAFLTVSVLYNFLDDVYSPYSNPVIRVGFGIGL